MTAKLKRIVTALALCCATSFALAAEDSPLEGLYAQLADPDNPNWMIAQTDILREWSKSGSAAMDLLLRRGQEAMEAGDLVAAIEHLTALTDHAPDFAEGWNARATAHFLNGDYGPSIADIGHTLALNPRHFGALAGLGQILEELGRPDEALRAYEEALKINPHMDGIRQAADRLRRDIQGTDL